MRVIDKNESMEQLTKNSIAPHYRFVKFTGSLQDCEYCVHAMALVSIVVTDVLAIAGREHLHHRYASA